MVFNSFVFLIFFLIVYPAYLLSNHKWQNKILLLASLIFYGWWDWRFLGLLVATILIDYQVALALDRTEEPQKRKRLLLISLVSNLGVLGFFKYFNFFTTNLERVLQPLGIPFLIPAFHIVLPVGISFYVFQSLSYTIDVYRKDLKAVSSLSDFALFVTYFPQLVAGPIERATNLVPQILKPRPIVAREVQEGAYLIFWGLFKKMFIADNLALIANPIFNTPGSHNGLEVLIGVYAFAFQIYCDFSGYSDIAIGLGKMMGFHIMTNFKLPYFALNPSDFWKRWHISLSQWLRDYLYIPLGGNRLGEGRTYFNLLATMLLGGLWHGASWNFVIWGAYHGVLLIVHRFLEPQLKRFSFNNPPALIARMGRVIHIILFFQLTCLGWLFFRARSLHQIKQMLFDLTHRFEYVPGIHLERLLCSLLFFAGPLVIYQIFQYRKNDTLFILKCKTPVRVLFYSVILYLTLLWGQTGGEQFIYFQF